MKKTTRTLAIILSVLLALAAAGYLIATWLDSSRPGQTAMVSGETYRSGPFRVTIGLQSQTPQVGENRLSLRITDVKGEPVSGASIKAYGEMAAMGAMAAMRAPADLQETAPGLYEGPFNLEMRGEWPLSLRISKEGMGEARLGFDMATGRPGLSLSFGGTRVENRMRASEGAVTAGGMPSAAMAPEADAEGYYTAGKYRLKLELIEAGASMGTSEAAMDGMMMSGTFTPGDNFLQVTVLDREGNPVEDAKVRAVAQLLDDAGGALEHTPVTHLDRRDSGVYQGMLHLDQKGTYSLAVDVASEALGHGDLILGFSTGVAGLQAQTATPEGISHYTCSMHPSVRKAGPGSCPICSMDLVPVTNEQVQSGVITIDARRRQLIGVKTAQATHKDLTKLIRAVGQIDYDERSVSDVSLRFDAWIGELKADSVGVPVRRGQVLFTVYSPELLSAQQEYLETRQRLSRRDPGDSLVQAARKRLMLWGISAAQLRLLEQRGTPLEYLPIHAPVSGIVVEKHVVDGGHAMTGKTLLRIADLSKVWVDAEVYEADLPLISEGMAATVSLPYLPGREYAATVDYIYPYLQDQSRTARVRLVLDNADGVLKPDMYAEVRLEVDLGHRLAVPEEAVLVAGESRVVFVDLGEGKLMPVRVKTGQRVAGWVVIEEGLESGDTVVTSGNFLIAAEAKLKTGIEQW